MDFVYDDGGREDAGYKGFSGDCACRAAAIASRVPYVEVYGAINGFAVGERLGTRKRSKSSARTGVYKNTMHKLMSSLGFEWTPTMQIGSGCTTHLRSEELPGGRIVVALSKHYAAVVDGVLHDTHDCSRDGTRCVYGYYSRR